MAENIFSRWKEGLARTSKATFGRIATVLGATEITEETWDELEALLIQADMGVDTALEVLDDLRQRAAAQGVTRTADLRAILREVLRQRLDAPPPVTLSPRPYVVLVVGVNGSGKTTTIAKLAKRFQDEGMRVLFGAADTFRAAAIDQLQVWGERLGVDVISGQQDTDPGAVAYNTVQAAVARNVDVAFIDTAGRLHTRYNLMEELKKVHRVAGKALPGAPHAVWLVLDATTGQNAIHQARAFKEAVDVSGVILTKLDTSARGGMAFAIQRALQLPILFAGLGETAADLQPFDPDAFISGILGEE